MKPRAPGRVKRVAKGFESWGIVKTGASFIHHDRLDPLRLAVLIVPEGVFQLDASGEYRGKLPAECRLELRQVSEGVAKVSRSGVDGADVQVVADQAVPHHPRDIVRGGLWKA